MQPLTEDEIRRILVVIPQDTPEGIHNYAITSRPIPMCRLIWNLSAVVADGCLPSASRLSENLRSIGPRVLLRQPARDLIPPQSPDERLHSLETSTAILAH